MPKDDNRNAGFYLLGWEDAFRILKGDAYWVDVRP